MVFGVHGATPDLKEKSITILDEICYDAPLEVLATCILNYFNIGESAAIKFFNSHLEKEEFKLYAALFLAQLGEHKQTFPIFAAALSSEDEYEVHTAIMGLAAIGTEEAIELILNLPPEKNRLTLRERLINFNPKDITKGDKL
jgi:HEAT repeat protein